MTWMTVEPGIRSELTTARGPSVTFTPRRRLESRDLRNERQRGTTKTTTLPASVAAVEFSRENTYVSVRERVSRNGELSRRSDLISTRIRKGGAYRAAPVQGVTQRRRTGCVAAEKQEKIDEPRAQLGRKWTVVVAKAVKSVWTFTSGDYARSENSSLGHLRVRNGRRMDFDY